MLYMKINLTHWQHILILGYKWIHPATQVELQIYVCSKTSNTDHISKFTKQVHSCEWSNYQGFTLFILCMCVWVCLCVCMDSQNVQFSNYSTIHLQYLMILISLSYTQNKCARAIVLWLLEWDYTLSHVWLVFFPTFHLVAFGHLEITWLI